MRRLTLHHMTVARHKQEKKVISPKCQTVPFSLLIKWQTAKIREKREVLKYIHPRMGFILNTDGKTKPKTPHCFNTMDMCFFFPLHDGEIQWYTFSAVKKKKISWKKKEDAQRKAGQATLCCSLDPSGGNSIKVLMERRYWYGASLYFQTVISCTTNSR